MKKILSALFTAATVFSIIFCPDTSFTVSGDAFSDYKPDEQIIYQQGFEDGFGSWAPLGGSADLKIDTRYSRKGSSSLHVSNRLESWNGPCVSTTNILLPGETYSFEAWVHHDGNEMHTINWTLQTTDSKGKTDYLRIAEGDVGADEWKALTGGLTIPENTESSCMYFETSDIELCFNVDAVTVKGGEQAEVSSLSSTGTVEFTYGFEEGTDGWKPRGNEVVSRSSNFSYIGRYSLYVSERTKFWNAPAINISSVIKPGICYEYSSYVMYNGRSYENEHDFIIALEYTSDGKINYQVLDSKTLQKGNWSRLSGDFTLPESATDISLYIQTADPEDPSNITENDLMCYYIDNITIMDSTVIKQRQLIKNFIIIALVTLSFAAIIIISLIIIKKANETSTLIANAEKDCMTDTFNRNSFEIQIAHLENCPEECRKIYITLCDVNFLKHINDNYGHQKGDDAIIRCAEILKKTTGSKGSVYRTGGDEFVCITKTNMQDKIKTAMNIESQQYKGYPFAVAVGTAKYDPSEDGNVPDIKLILARSDKEMYNDKQQIKESSKNFI